MSNLGSNTISSAGFSLDKKEIDQFLQIIKQNFGYDFTLYAKSSVSRRIARLMTLSSINSMEELILKTTGDGVFVRHFVNEVTVNTTEMFRDATFWIYIRGLIKDLCKSSSSKVKVWHAGCSTGEEVISMAIITKELGVSDQVELIATDLNETVISKSREGEYPLRNLELCKENYIHSGGKTDFQEYYAVVGNCFQMSQDLFENVKFKVHDLVKDNYDKNCNLIICRNVLIYFNKELQDKVVGNMTRGLKPRGYLAIGSKESIDWSQHSYKYTIKSESERIYQLCK